jgi:aspartyl-tRNA(Asn)/glutamyl-tRNA(Gln) amidotransferase subunit B
MKSEFEVVIGLEVHVQVNTRSKIFCSCSTDFGAPPNTQVCPICLGMPGVLPVFNEEVLRKGIIASLALNCNINEIMKFDRKHYFYPDLPKAYQISQYDNPLAEKGYIEIEINGKVKRIGIIRLHIEEDAGKLIHREGKSYVDLNRAGVPLLEIVSAPDIRSPEEAYLYLQELKAIMQYADVSECDMEKGSLRCDANISIKRKEDKELGVKVEIKNLNSFKAVRDALEYEKNRQIRLLKKGEKVIQETRLYSAEKNITLPMRSKEEAHDYRYFPEPDLPIYRIEKGYINELKGVLGELPKEKRKRFLEQYKLPEYDVKVLTSRKELANFFEEVVKNYPNPKAASNWIMSEVMGYINQKGIDIKTFPIPPSYISELLSLVDTGKISIKIAKEIFPNIIEEKIKPSEYIEKHNLLQISDESAIKDIIKEVLDKNQDAVKRYKSGRKNVFGFFVGEVMKRTKGKANPKLVSKILNEELSKI